MIVTEGVTMSGILPPSSSSGDSVPVNPSAAVKADAHTAGLAASGDKNATTAATKVNSLEDLREKAPDVYRAMMVGLAQSMIKKWERAEDRRQRMVKEFERR
jgi:uncharacterized protein YmfQ (DUF2313 family)